jgi:hypothetical protein
VLAASYDVPLLVAKVDVGELIEALSAKGLLVASKRQEVLAGV